MWGTIDGLHIEWTDTTITQYDSCVTGEILLDTISAFDTTYFKDYNYITGDNSTKFYDSGCGDTVIYIEQYHQLAFYNVDFGTNGANFMEVKYYKNLPSGEIFGYVNDANRNRVGTFTSEPASGCTSINVQLTQKLYGVQDLYFYGTVSEVLSAGWLHWFRCYNVAQLPYRQWKLRSNYRLEVDTTGRWLINR